MQLERAVSNANASAMPVISISFDHREQQYTSDVQDYGLTKREYAAIQIMASMYASCYPASSEQDGVTFMDRFKTGRDRRADEAIKAADTLLSALEKQP